MAYSLDKSLVGPLNTVLGIEDLHDVLEVAMIDAHNRRIVEKEGEKK